MDYAEEKYLGRVAESSLNHPILGVVARVFIIEWANC
jgi:hypothetical protein